ncbi:MAG: ferredoxin--NADP reductase, partial [Planctomycetota bacterium]
LTLLVAVGGEELRRSYSLCTAPGGGAHAVTIKRVPGGRVSNHLNDHAAAGMRLHSLPPAGRFTFEPTAAPDHLVLIGGGSGLTPLLSMLRTAVRDTPGTRVTLLLGNRDAASILFRDALDRLADEVPRVTVRHVLEQPPVGWDGGVGRLDRETLAGLLDEVPDEDGVRYGLCGPGPMMEGAKRLLLDRGVARERITEERFTPAARPPVAVTGTPQPVVYRIGGVDRQVVVQPGQTFLDAALEHDVPMAWSCGGGGCGSCLMKLEFGDVDQPAADALLDRERDEGWFLGCCARPTAPCVVHQR